MVGLQKVLIRLETDARALNLHWALIGGLAVSARAEPRTTQDLDVAVAVGGDREAERVTADFQARGYTLDSVLEHLHSGRLATVRLLAPGQRPGGYIVDLLFASSGVEPEIVAMAESLEVLPGLDVPVATVGHLLALKVLASRAKDLDDIERLMNVATAVDLETARETLTLIVERGYARDKDVQTSFAEILASYSPNDPPKGFRFRARTDDSTFRGND